MERGRTQLTNNYDDDRLNIISRQLEWRSDGILISPSDYSFLRERIDYWKRQALRDDNDANWEDLFELSGKLDAAEFERDQLRADRMRMMLERNDARWIARKLWNWAVAQDSDEMDRAWADMPEWMTKAILDDDG